MLDWIENQSELLGWLGVVAAALSVLSLVAMPWLVAVIPSDYFLYRERERLPWQDRRPGLAMLLRILKNTLGVVLILAGIAMLVLPGQGILTILAGLVLAEGPGKRRAERWLIGKKGVLKSLNWIRNKMKRDPLLPPEPDAPTAAR